MNKLNTIDWVALALVLIGALNWGLVGVFGLDLVETIFGDMTVISRVVYVVVGVAAVYVLVIMPKLRKE